MQEFGEAELKRDSVPNALYHIVDFIRKNGSWSGSATELLELVDDNTLAPNKLIQHITRHYYDVFSPAGISYEYKRESKIRRITLYYDPAKDKTKNDPKNDDGSDGNDGPL